MRFVNNRSQSYYYLFTLAIASTMSVSTEKLVVNKLTTIKPPKKLKPARKQVKPGEVEKKETPQTGKEYST